MDDTARPTVQSFKDQVLSQIRHAIWTMNRQEDMGAVLKVMVEGLGKMAVPFESCGINLVNRRVDPPVVESYNVTAQAGRGPIVVNGSGQMVILQIWRQQQPAYRRDLAKDDLYGEAEWLSEHGIRSVVDIPFAQGTLAVNSMAPDAFSAEDIGLLEEVTHVLSEGFTRLDDLQALARRNRELEREIAKRKQAEEKLKQESLLREADHIIRVAIASMDQPQHLYRVVEAIRNQLQQMGVIHDSCTIQILNSQATDFISTPSFTSVIWGEEVTRFFATGQRGAEESNLVAYPWVFEVWKTGKSRYDPRVKDRTIRATDSENDVSLIDVAFSQGTLAINRIRPNAFGEQDIALLEHFAGILSEGFQRFKDIAERQRSEEALRANEERYRTLIERLPIGIITNSPDGSMPSYNPKAMEMFGWTEEDLTTLTPEEVYGDLDNRRELIEHLNRDGHHEFEYWLKRKDGTPFLVRGRSIAIFGADGQPLRYEGYMEDITERKKIEEALQEAHDKLELRVGERTADLQEEIAERKQVETLLQESNSQLLTYQRQLRGLAAQLALAEERERRRIATQLHDHIGQTLAVCRMKLNLLSTAPSNLPIKAQFDEISQLLGQTIQETRTLTLELSPPVLYELGFEAAIKWLAGHFTRQYGVAFEVGSDNSDIPLNEAARAGLFQVVRELMINVVKHAKVERAQVRLSREGDQLKVEVEDQGCGFSPDQLARPGEKELETFGLFSIQERVTALDGSLRIVSNPGQGAQIMVKVPLA